MYDNVENQELLRIIEEIRRRDGWTFSKLTHEALKDWAKNHYTNPQMVLARFSGESKVNTICDYANCDKTATHEVWAHNNWHGHLCDLHKERNENARLLKRCRRL